MEFDNLILLDLFSGIGGFHKGLSDAGFKFRKTYFSEIDKHAIANYRYNFKNAEYAGTVETLLSGRIRKPNIITFGSPCQDFSLAGKREGLKGAKSSLITYALNIIKHYRPDVFIWENVKGVFSSNAGADFWAVIQSIANIGGYRIEWQLLNTAWFLPQNRERIYLVERIAEKCTGEIFPIGETGSLCDTERKDKKEIHDVALTLMARGQQAWTGSFIRQLNPSMESKGSQPYQQNRVYDVTGIAPCLDSKAGIWNIYAQRGRYDNSGKIKQKLEPRFDGLSNTLTGVCKDNLVNGIRRLTEIECERLQGFGDDWSRWGIYDGVIKEISASNRYKMCGNAVSVPVVAAVGTTILSKTIF